MGGRRERDRHNLSALEGEQFDVVIIGGGIIGAGIARDAAMRGLSVALFEKADYGGGTTAGSTRLIHGGLRYLEMLDFRLVRIDLFPIGIDYNKFHQMATDPEVEEQRNMIVGNFADKKIIFSVDRLDYEKDGATTSVAVAPEDIVLVTTGSQAADLSVGSMTQAPAPRNTGRSWALWRRLAQGRKDFGNPDNFFGAPRIADSRWVTFTVTTTGDEFVERITKLLGGVEPGCGGLQTLRDSGWVISFSIRNLAKFLVLEFRSP